MARYKAGSKKSGNVSKKSKEVNNESGLSFDELLARLTFDDKMDLNQVKHEERNGEKKVDPKTVHRRFHKFL